MTSTFVQSLLLSLNTHHSWIVRSLWPRNSFKYQIYNKRSETAQKKLWISTGVNCKNLFEKRNRRKQEVPSFRVPEKKFASPCTILRRFFFWVCIRLQIASSQNAYVWKTLGEARYQNLRLQHHWWTLLQSTSKTYLQFFIIRIKSDVTK